MALTDETNLTCTHEVRPDGAAAREGDASSCRGLLDVVPSALPALRECQEVSRLAAGVGFEWDTVADVWAQVAEERDEFAREEHGSSAAALEFGDLLFALVNVARHEGIDAEGALAASTAKFRRRWAAMERLAWSRGTDVVDLSTAEQNVLWREVKSLEAASRPDGSQPMPPLEEV